MGAKKTGASAEEGEDPCDPLVRQLDVLIEALANWRAEIADVPVEDLHVRYAAAVEAMRRGLKTGHDLPSVVREVQDRLDRRKQIETSVGRLMGALSGPPLTHAERRSYLVDAIRLRAWSMHLQRAEGSTVNAESLARELSADVSRWWPEVGARMAKHAHTLGQVMEAMKAGRPARGATKVTVEGLLTEYLKKVGLEGNASTLRSARRRRRK